MTETSPDIRPWETLARHLDAGETDEVPKLLAELSLPDTARCLERLKAEHRQRVLESVGTERAAEIIEYLPEAQSEEILENVSPDQAAAILEELPADEQADLITAMPAESAQKILAEMNPVAALEANELASYDPDTAGGLMSTRFVCFHATSTAEEVRRSLRAQVRRIREIEVQYLYVTDDRDRLVGVLPLRNLMLSDDDAPIEQSMIGSPLVVEISADLDELVDLFDKHAFLGVPVVTENGDLRGIVHRRDVDDAWTRRSESDLRLTQGIVGGDELRSMPLLTRSRRRLSWLSVNILLNIVAASVIAAHQDTLEAVIALAVFLPIISDMSGCSGNQAVAVSMRELTLGVVKPVDVFYVWRKEVTLGLVNGVVLGTILAGAAWVWKSDPTLGLVVGAALAINTVLAVSVGGGIPLLLKRFDLDPALASGPILTTLTDMCGFLLALTLASALLVQG